MCIRDSAGGGAGVEHQAVAILDQPGGAAGNGALSGEMFAQAALEGRFAQFVGEGDGAVAPGDLAGVYQGFDVTAGGFQGNVPGFGQNGGRAGFLFADRAEDMGLGVG